MSATPVLARFSLLMLLHVSHVSAQSLKCVYDLMGDRYDLWKLHRPMADPYRIFRGSTSFTFNICDAVSGCGANLPSPGCKRTSIGGMETAIGSMRKPEVHPLTAPDIDWINRNTGKNPPFTMNDGGRGVKMVFAAQQSFGAASVSSEGMTILIPCDSNAIFPVPIHYITGAKYETAAEGFIFVLPSVHGCPTNMPLPQMADEPLSFGWVFIILLAVTTTLYCGIGIGCKMHRYGVRGEEAIPHIEFWRELPHLVSDGINFSIRYCQNAENRGIPSAQRVSGAFSGNSYNPVL